ncbi:ester cyclase [Zunongwangia atlantica]|uniref:SnoaL-like polyketide cyclase n=1 Tax=Zunongwangia atlantica 22II14-10F7 TaxID=1185767 RepID=A0A1Y1T372_9FLAO|nr:ester cyclase [Zunongwangia atlantica]ORL45054.1 SnoaL-like polyketide cyclase [Zunongwangia atlantica 22II14-10F7]
MKPKIKHLSNTILLLLVSIALFSSCSNNKVAQLESKVQQLEKQLKVYKDDEAINQERLKAFDSLDFEFYSDQKWENFSHSHASDIVVYNADGSISKGLYPNHIDDLKPMFVFAPDTKIEKHPVKFGKGEYTAVIGELQGTFTEPMPIGNGQNIPPTGKKFKLRMATIGHWENGKMTEEYLFYDNLDFMKQIGLAE